MAIDLVYNSTYHGPGELDRRAEDATRAASPVPKLRVGGGTLITKGAWRKSEEEMDEESKG